MAALHERRERLLDALYRQFGESAAWQLAAGGAAIPITVRRRGPEMVDVQFGGGADAMVTATFLRVRVSDLPSPAQDDTVTVETAPGVTEAFTVYADPRRVKQGLEWECEVVAS